VWHARPSKIANFLPKWANGSSSLNLSEHKEIPLDKRAISKNRNSKESVMIDQKLGSTIGSVA
jgi:hypothetical protein